MEPRSFLVSTTAALSLALTTGCGPAIVGDWDLKSVTYAGSTYDYPYVYNGTYDGHTYDIVVSGLATFARDLTGSFTIDYSYAVDGGTPEVETSTYAATATKVSGKEYGIVVPDQELDLACTIEKKEMTCNSNGEDDQTIVFARAEG